MQSSGSDSATLRSKPGSRDRVNSVNGKHLYQFFGDTTYSQLLPYIQAALSGRHASLEITLLRHDGESLATQFILVPQAGNDDAIVGF